MSRSRLLSGVACGILAAACAASQPFEESLLDRNAVASDRAVSRGAGPRDFGRARQAGPLLLRRRRRRSLDDGERRAHLGAHLGLAADRLDRGDRDRALGSERDLRRLGRGRHALGHLLRQRHVQVAGRRKELDPDRASGQPSDRTRDRRPERHRPRLRRRARARLRAQRRARRLPLAGRWQDLAARPPHRRRHRRDRPRVRAGQRPHDLRRPLADAAAPLERLPAFERPGQRALSV